MSRRMIAVVNGITIVPIKPDPHGGTTIGRIWPGQRLDVLVDDPESPHDGMVTVLGPNPDPVRDDGTWKDTNIVGWIKLSRLTELAPGDKQYLLTIKENGDASITRIK